jgi:hypothetical protein
MSDVSGLVYVIKELHPGAKPKLLKGGLNVRRYELHGMSELVLWRDDGVEPSVKELELMEDALRLLYAPDVLVRTIRAERSGSSFAYRFFWPHKKGKMQLQLVQARLPLSVEVKG